MRIQYTILLFAAFLSSEVLGEIPVKLVADYFSSPGLDVRTIILITCSPNDEQLWLRHISERDLSFYTGRGGLDEKCELREDTLGDSYRKLGVFVDYDCRCAEQAVMQVDSYNFTLDIISWFYWSTQVRAEDLSSLQIELKFFNEVRFALQNGETFQLFDVYRISDGMLVESVLVATYNHSTGLSWILGFEKYRMRFNFQNVTLQGALTLLEYNISEPNLFEILKDHNQDKSKDTVPRIFFDLWDIVQEVHNFSINVTLLDNIGYTKNENGTYDGLLGLLQTGKTDLSLTGIGMLDFRLSVVDYNNLIVWPFQSSFFLLQPRLIKRSTVLIYPFRGIVWLTSFLVVFMASLLISLIAFFDKSMKVSIGSALLYISGIFSQQGAVLASQWVSGRFLLFTSLIFGWLLLNYYSGQVVSEILSKAPPTITTPKELLDSPLLLATDEVPPYLGLRHKIQRSHCIPELGAKAEKTGGFMSLEKGIVKVKSSLYAFETEVSKAHYLIDKTWSQAEICTLGEIAMPNVGSFVALKNRSPFKQPFSITVIMLNERGILKRLDSQWRYPKPQCTGVTNIRPVDLENASFAFYILFTGAAAGCITFFIENFTSKLTLSRNQKKKT